MTRIYVRFKGRLGNWLFQYAVALANADEVVGENQDEDVRTRVKNSSYIFSDIKFADRMPADVIAYQEPSFRFSSLPGGVSQLAIDGSFQSPKYFNHARDRILAKYLPDKEKLVELKTKAREWIDVPEVTAIHVRRGDYLKLQYRHPFVGKLYFVDAIKRLPEAGAYVVFSDDIPWCRRFFRKAFPFKKFFFVEGNSAIDDMLLQSLCKNNIISNSSFSWWGAWLNQNKTKTVIAPSMWFGFVTDRDVWQDVYDEGWTVVHNEYTSLQWVLAKFQYYKKKTRLRIGKLLRRR